MSIPRIQSNLIGELPRPVVDPVSLPPPVRPSVPVVRGIQPPVVDVPDTSIEYPTIDLQTEAEFRGQMNPQSQQPPVSPPPDTRDLPETPETPTIEVGGVDIPLPDPAPIVAASTMAVATTAAALVSTVIFTQVKSGLDPFIKQLLKPKKKKVKIKQVKPVLHFVPSNDGTTDLIEYSQKGMKVLKSGIEKLEEYIRDQVEIDSLWEYDNKIIIDEELSKQLTKEGQKRFKRHFVAPKVVAKKLGSKFAF